MQQKKRQNTPPLIYLYKDLYYYFFLVELTARVISGSASPRTHSAVIFMPTISSSDGASNMIGSSNGMTVALKRLIQRHCAEQQVPFNEFNTVWCFAPTQTCDKSSVGVTRSQGCQSVFRVVFRPSKAGEL